MANRNQQIKLPGKFVWDPAGSPVAMYSSTGWKAEIVENLVQLPSTRWGEHAQVITGRLVKVSGQPTQFTAPALAKLFTHASVRMGGSIVGATDQAAELHTVDGQVRKMKCAFVFQEPACTYMAGKTILGEVVIYGIVPLTGGSDDMDNLWKKEAKAWSDADWDPDTEITPGWDFGWGSEEDAWADIDTKDKGVTITPKSGLTEDASNRDGLVNVTINNYEVNISAQAMNISEELVLAALGKNLKMGQRKNSLGRDIILNATDGSAFTRAYNAVLQPNSFAYDAVTHVVSDLNWRTFPLVTDGVRGPHLLVSTEDPDAEE